MRKPITLAIVIGSALFWASLSALAGDYDGTYKGETAYKAGNPGICAPAPMVISIKDQHVHWSGRFDFDGSLQNDGSFTLSGIESGMGKGNFQFKVEIEGKVGGGKVVGTASSGNCDYTFAAALSPEK